jgi:uncharacterized protein (DUF433 family)
VDANRLGAGLYSPGDIVRIAKVRPQVFQAWIKAGLLIPTVRITAGKRAQNVYSYRDLLLIRLIVRLREKGFPVGKIKRALDNIVAAAGGDPGAWLESSIYADKDLIAAILPGSPAGAPFSASQGPQTLAVALFPELVEELERDLVPKRFQQVKIDPEILAGAPVLAGTRVPTQAVLLTRRSGQDPREAYPALTEEQVEAAIAYEEFLEQA